MSRKIPSFPSKATLEATDELLLTDTVAGVSKKVTADKLASAVDKGVLSGELVSADADNLLEQGTDNLLKVDADTLNSGDADNLMEVASNKLKVDADSLISADANNLLTKGSDEKLDVQADDINSGDADNMLSVSGGKLKADAPDFISADAGNAIVEGSDSKLYASSSGGGGAWELISSAEISSAVASIDFLTGFDSDILQHKIVFSDITVEANRNIEYQFIKEDLNIATLYNWVQWGGSLSDTSPQYSKNVGGSDVQMIPFATGGSGATAIFSGEMNIQFMYDTDKPTVCVSDVIGFDDSSGSSAVSTQGGSHCIASNDNTERHAGIRIKTNVGNMFSGTFYHYGLKKV